MWIKRRSHAALPAIPPILFCMGDILNAADDLSAACQPKVVFNNASAISAGAGELWLSYHHASRLTQANNLTTLLGEISEDDGGNARERCIELLLKLGDHYESEKDYIRAAACFHKAIPPHDKLDTYAWQRRLSLQDKAEAQINFIFSKDAWDALLNETWDYMFEALKIFEEPLKQPVETCAAKPIVPSPASFIAA